MPSRNSSSTSSGSRGRGSNLSPEDRKRGGQNSHSGGQSSKRGNHS